MDLVRISDKTPSCAYGVPAINYDRYRKDSPTVSQDVWQQVLAMHGGLSSTAKAEGNEVQGQVQGKEEAMHAPLSKWYWFLGGWRNWWQFRWQLMM